MDTTWLNQGILLGITVAAVLAGFGIHSLYRKREKSGDEHAGSLSRLTDVIAFLTGAIGILIGLLLSISVTNFQTSQSNLNEFNSSVGSLFHDAQAFEPSSRETLRADVSCVVESFWKYEADPSVQNTAIGHTQTNLWMAQLSRDTAELTLATSTEESTHFLFADGVGGLNNWRSQLLSNSTQQLPLVIWVVIYVTAFILLVLLTMSLADKRRYSVLAIIATYVSLAVMIFGLNVLEFPLHNEGFGGVIATGQTTALIDDLYAVYPESTQVACPELTAGKSAW